MVQEQPYSQTLERKLLASPDFPKVVALCKAYAERTLNELAQINLVDNSGIAEYNRLQGELRAYSSIINLPDMEKE